MTLRKRYQVWGSPPTAAGPPLPTTFQPTTPTVRWLPEQGEETAGEGSGPSDGAGADQMVRVNSRTATTTAATATRKKNMATFAALAITLIQA
jgi:hypothetical protein